MRRSVSRAARPLLIAAVLLAFTEKPVFDYLATTWDFPAAKLSFSAKAKKLGHLKTSLVDVGQVVLNGDLSWSLVYQGSAVASGLWVVKDVFDKSLELDIDPTGQQALFDFMAAQLEAAVLALGFSDDVTLDTAVVEKVRLFVKPDFKHQTATVKLVASCKLTGLTDGQGQVDAPTTCKAKLVGTSDEVPLASILP